MFNFITYVGVDQPGRKVKQQQTGGHAWQSIIIYYC